MNIKAKQMMQNVSWQGEDEEHLSHLSNLPTASLLAQPDSLSSPSFSELWTIVLSVNAMLENWNWDFTQLMKGKRQVLLNKDSSMILRTPPWCLKYKTNSQLLGYTYYGSYVSLIYWHNRTMFWDVKGLEQSTGLIMFRKLSKWWSKRFCI